MKKIFLSAILAGAVIAFGGTVFLSVENTVIGSLFFTIGLFPPQKDYRLHMGGSWEHVHRLDPHRLVALLLK